MTVPPRRAPELFDLHGRVAIVTGSGSGLGQQMATGLAEAGATVVVCGRRLERCQTVAQQLHALGARSIAVRCDVTDIDDVHALIDTTTTTYGTLDILVNNSGTTSTAPAEEHSLQAWNDVIAVNLTGTFLCSQAAGRIMLEQGHGKIINIAGIAGLRGSDPTVRQAIGYSASKGGVLAFTRDLACQWAHRGIHVNAIAPGTFPTAIMHPVLDTTGEPVREGIPLGRYGNHEDLKGAVIFLSSPASDFITGHTLVIDGGKTVGRWTNLQA
jgi:NAD(P)-dependent dehydrogenase (short-subunit alcohol dehydrogenase family)